MTRGSRYRGIMIRILIFYGMMGLYSLCFGLESDNGVSPWAMGAWLLLACGLVPLFFLTREKRTPTRKELRQKALMYLCFAAVAAFWFFMLYLVEASPVSWKLGSWFLVPALLVISLGLLIASLVRRKEDGAEGSEEALEEPKWPVSGARERAEERAVWRPGKPLIVLLIVLGVLLNLGFLAALSFAFGLGELKGLAFGLGVVAVPLDAAGIAFLIRWFKRR